MSTLNLSVTRQRKSPHSKLSGLTLGAPRARRRQYSETRRGLQPLFIASSNERYAG
ncbi:hypothetical protein DO72_5892 [Burkholderia pseudomallei]|nr:hypothetical protein DO72_5892 [Burkholderia pseudomallei]